MNVQALHPREHEDAVRVAISWLSERHRKGWRNAFEDLLNLWRPQGHEDEWQLNDDVMTMVSINAGECLIARGQIHARGGLREINSYLLGHDGPYLTPGQKAWIAQLFERPLRLYRVTDVLLGVGLTLVDELDRQAEPLTVRERSGSRDTKPGMLMGARIMRIGSGAEATGGHLELSGAVYPFAKLRETQLLARMHQMQEGAAAMKLHHENMRDLLETEIARAWLAQWFEPSPLPQIRDASTGDPILLVTDHYRVADPVALAAALAAQADVIGDAQQGWQRLSHSDDSLQRMRSTINPGRQEGRVEVFHRTQRLADEGRTWFETLAGSAVQHLTREITDPAGSLASSGKLGAKHAPQAPAASASGLAPEVMSQVFEQFIHRHYANWCDETIPALGGVSPRQAITTPAGLERVKGLLREYEGGELRQSVEERRPAVSYQFLWDALSIPR